jgi:hypothetical protein
MDHRADHWQLTAADPEQFCTFEEYCRAAKKLARRHDRKQEYFDKASSSAKTLPPASSLNAPGPELERMNFEVTEMFGRWF